MNEPGSKNEIPSDAQPSSRRAFLKASSFASILAAIPSVLVGLITTAGSADAATTAPATTAPPGTGTTVPMICKKVDSTDATGSSHTVVIDGQAISITAHITANIVADPDIKYLTEKIHTATAYASEVGAIDSTHSNCSMRALNNPYTAVITHDIGYEPPSIPAIEQISQRWTSANHVNYAAKTLLSITNRTPACRSTVRAYIAQQNGLNGPWVSIGTGYSEATIVIEFAPWSATPS